ncbi:MAG: Stp1/IreP family PP2C-type Ser/Thr phosphatase [Lactobacillales bacterium]|nr:Stp1/IreP family PP2C-type Ser/Thr phosphatase [Lactobacillales bacterium]
MKINYLSDVGLKRNSNQDYARIFKNKAGRTLAVLADGMGGHKAGDVASKMTVETIGATWEETEFDIPEKVAQWFIQEIQEINEEVYEKGQQDENYLGMGTTIVAVAIFDDSFTLAHVGDSRAYVVRGNRMLQLTEDHSLVNDLVKAGELSAEEAINHPRKNVLTRTVGMPGLVEVDVTNQHWLAGDYLLINSDGLTNMVSDEKILEILELDISLEEKVKKLVDEANNNGGRDNITVLLIHFGEEDEQ